MGGYRYPMGSLEMTVRRAEQQELNAELKDAYPAKACQCPNPFTYHEADGEKRCTCGREARS